MSNIQITPMNEKPQLVISQDGGKALGYSCSLCGQWFILQGGRIPKEAMAEVWGEYKRHVQENHTLPNQKGIIIGNTED